MRRALFRVALAEARGDGAPSIHPRRAGDGVGERGDRPELAEAASGASEEAPSAEPRTYQKVEMPTPEQMMMDGAMNNCVVKSVLATVMGGFLGAAMGIFFGAFEPHAWGREALGGAVAEKRGRASTAKAASYAKGFAVFGALYSGSGRGGADAREARHLQQRMRGVLTGASWPGRAGRRGWPSGVNDGGALVAMDHFMDLH